MANDNDVYIRRNPGDLISAEDWNDVQARIKKDINEQVQLSKEEIVNGKVKEAENAELFAQTSRMDWLKFLDERYAIKGHGHEGRSVYKRFIKRFDKKTNEVLLEHGLGRFPLVDVYELENVISVSANVFKPFSLDRTADTKDYKIVVYYGHADEDKYKLYVKAFRDRVPLGYPLEQLLTELQVDYEDDDTLHDVIDEMWSAFMKDPNDELEHGETPWISDCIKRRCTVANLKEADEWNDIYVALKLRKCGKGTDILYNYNFNTDPPTEYPKDAFCQVEINQVNYNTIHIKIPDEYFVLENAAAKPIEFIDLMFLLRI